jgi:hypothetical protein
VENSGTKELSRYSIVVGRVRIITSLWQRLAMIVPCPFSLIEWTKSSLISILRSSASKLRFGPSTPQMTQFGQEVDQSMPGHWLASEIRWEWILVEGR